MILSDGTQVMFIHLSSECTSNQDGTNDACATIYVDLNGERNPNVLGKDVFQLILKESGLYPSGCKSATPSDWYKACYVLRTGTIDY